MTQIGEVLSQALDMKWQWYTVILETDHHDEIVEVEAYNMQDALERAVIAFKATKSTSVLEGDAYVFIGRKQLMTFDPRA